MRRTALLGSVLLLLATSPAAHAEGGSSIRSADAPRVDPQAPEQPKADPSQVEHKTLEAFGTDNPGCMEWTDGCAVCARPHPETGSHEIACSLPGIACQPGAILCKPAPVATPH